MKKLGWVVLACWLWSTGVLAETLTQQFRNADIREVIEAVAKLTGKNFIIDPRVKGKVTLIAPSPMPADQLYATLLEVLRVHGYGAVPGDGVIKIIPLSQVRDKLPAQLKSHGGEAWESRVLETRWLEANQLVPVLRPLVAREGLITALPQSNYLIITDTQANIDRIAAIVQRLDQPGTEYDVMSLRYADGEQLLASLRPLLPKGVKVAFDARANQLILSGAQEPRLQLKALVAQLDVPVASEGQVSVVYLHYAKAKILAGMLAKLAKSDYLLSAASDAPAEKGKTSPAKTRVASGSEQSSNVRIEADERLNALLISGPPAVVKSLKQVIKQLDIRRAQVLIEAVVVELSANKAANLGVEWGASGTNGVGIINFTGALPTLLGNIGNPAAQASAIGTGITGVVGEQTGPNTGWAAFIRALKSDSQANILSTPTLMTLDNEEAEIIVGREVPFQTGSYTSTGTTTTPTNPFTTIKRENVGLKLKLKPLINAGDEVQLDLALELSDVLPKGEAVDLQTSKREIKTSVIVGNGNVIVLGGLLTEKETETNAKVPGLGDVPLLGALFRNQQNQREKVNLMMFIRPVIIRDGVLSQAYSRKKYHQLYQEQGEMLKRWDNGLLQGLRPRLKPYETLKGATSQMESAPTQSVSATEKAPEASTLLDELEALGVY